ncbi:hypothetical protein BOTBODRAFT_501723 [Botryobasidium botryosum FD-172 SS1]|uniref:Uncharacterized protein n=1 Tax=Botryobasidium botryosum (strain FD-172 SS1) TaxID=930990 RepID=A0A067ME00_BOTB1|nr:hypothetical protein BOTBODRAFT_501723 [Botryobasidium botryosum FD-172 SS1]
MKPAVVGRNGKVGVLDNAVQSCKGDQLREAGIERQARGSSPWDQSAAINGRGRGSAGVRVKWGTVARRGKYTSVFSYGIYIAWLFTDFSVFCAQEEKKNVAKWSCSNLRELIVARSFCDCPREIGVEALSFFCVFDLLPTCIYRCHIVKKRSRF